MQHRRLTVARLARSLLVLPLAALVLSPAPAAAEVVWTGDFETGNTKQWTGGSMNAKRWSVLRTPVRQGLHAARVELHDGDLGSSDLTRAELIYRPDKASLEGSERYIAWSMMPSSALPLQAGSHWVAYFESEPSYKPLIVFDADGKNISFHCFLRTPTAASAGRLWRAPFTPDRWHDFVLHMKFSPDPTVGFVELSVDGVVVVPKTFVQTMHREKEVTQPSSFHVGILRRFDSPAVEDLFWDGVVWATAAEDVKHSPAPDGGAVAPTDAGPRPDADTADGGAPRDASPRDAPSPDPAAPRPDARRPDPGPTEEPEDPPSPGKAAGGCAIGGKRGAVPAAGGAALLLFSVVVAFARRARFGRGRGRSSRHGVGASGRGSPRG